MNSNSSDVADHIDELVWMVNAREERGVTADEVEQALHERGVDVSERKVRYELDDMVDKGLLRRQQGPSLGSPGRPPMLYYHSDKVDELLPSGDTIGEEGEIEHEEFSSPDNDRKPSFDAGEGVEYTIESDRAEETIRREVEEADQAPTEFDFIDEIREQHLSKSDVAREIRAIAPELLEVDPRDLLIELTEWTLTAIDNLGERLVEAHHDNRLREERRIKTKLEGLLRFTEWYLGKVYRLDFVEDGAEAILTVPDIKDYYDVPEGGGPPRTSFDKAAARDKLVNRVFGEHFLDIWEIDNVEAVAGTDSSIAEVHIPNPRDPLVRKTEIDLFTGAAALQRESEAYTDYDFDPETLKRSNRQDAFRDGLMSSRRIRGLTDSELQKSRYAALDLRMYNQTIRVVTDRANWEPVGRRGGQKSRPEPDVVYGDGRVMPLVHQISDYLQRGLYGDLARNEMRRYAELLAHIDENNTLVDTTFAGVVKHSHLTWLAPLVFFYLEVDEDEKAPESPEDVPDDVFQPPINDPVIAHLLADGINQQRQEIDRDISEDKVIVTFRVLRRFYDHSLDRSRDFPLTYKLSNGVVDVDSETDWEKYFDEFIEDRENRGYKTIGKDEMKIFRNLCARAATVMVYAAPCRLYENDSDLAQQFVLPRIEVAKSPARGPAEVEMKRAVSGFALTYNVDHDHTFDHYSTMDDTPVLVPDVIREADLAAKFVKKGVGRKFEQEFRQLVAAAREKEAEATSD